MTEKPPKPIRLSSEPFTLTLAEMRLLKRVDPQPSPTQPDKPKPQEKPYEFIVPEAQNPYREALLKAGCPESDLTAETREVTLDIHREILRQLAIYNECVDSHGHPHLPEWIKDIEDNQHLLLEAVSRDRASIIERIKNGMIPIVMPSRTVQEVTWERALKKLKPIWIERKVEEVVKDASLSERYKEMNQAGFFKNIPNHPYLVWTKPSQRPDAETCNKSFEDQQAYLVTLAQDHPDLYGATDITPLEYIALQAIFTRTVLKQFKEAQGEDATPTAIKPLDCNSYTRFLSDGAFSCGDVPRACFSPDSDDRRVRFGNGGVNALSGGGFRPASRS